MRHFLYGGAPAAVLLALVMLSGSEARAQMPSQRGATSKIQGRFNALGGEILRPGMGYYYAPVIGGVRNNQRSYSYATNGNWSNTAESGRSFSYSTTPANKGPCDQQNADQAQPPTPPPPVPDTGK